MRQLDTINKYIFFSFSVHYPFMMKVFSSYILLIPNKPITQPEELGYYTGGQTRTGVQLKAVDTIVVYFVLFFTAGFFPLHWVLYTGRIFTLSSAPKCSHWNKFESLPHKMLCPFGHYSRSLLFLLSRYPAIVFQQFKHLSWI